MLRRAGVIPLVVLLAAVSVLTVVVGLLASGTPARAEGQRQVISSDRPRSRAARPPSTITVYGMHPPSRFIPASRMPKPEPPTVIIINPESRRPQNRMEDHAR